MKNEELRLSIMKTFIIFCACLLFLGLKVNTYADVDEEEIFVEDTKEINVNRTIHSQTLIKVFKFTPETDGVYVLTSTAFEETQLRASLCERVVEDNISYDNSIADAAGHVGTRFVLAHKLEAGKTYYYYLYVDVALYSPFSYSVTLEKSNVCGIAFEPVKTKYIKDEDGMEQNTGGSTWFDYMVQFREGDRLTVKYDDGSEKNYIFKTTETDFNGSFYNTADESDVLDTLVVKYVDNQREKPWSIDNNDNYYTVTCYGYEAKVPITIVNIDSINFQPKEPITIFENTNGVWKNDEEKWYYYSLSDIIYQAGNKLTVNYDENTSIEYTYDDNVWEFVSDNGETIGECYKALNNYIYLDSDQQENHWKPGGSGLITLKCMGATCTCPVTIIKNPVAVSAVNLNKTSLEMTVGGAETLAATVLPANADDKSVAWTSSDETVATVSADGRVTAVKEGTAVITVTTNDGRKKATCNVTVKAQTVNPGGPGSGETPAPVVQPTKVKAVNPLTIKAKKVTIKFNKLKKKDQALAVSKVINFVKQGQGTISYKLSNAKKGKKNFKKFFKINAKTGKVTVKKGLKKGTYNVTLKVQAKGNNNFMASPVKTVTIKIKVK